MLCLYTMKHYYRLRNSLLDLPRRSIVLFVITFFPPEQWYWKAWYLTRLLARTKKVSADINRGSFGIIHAFVLDGVLALLTETNTPFFIPVRIKGIENIKSINPEGKIICSLHLPLYHVALAVLDKESSMPVYSVKGLNNEMKEAGMTEAPVWGRTERIKIIPTGHMSLIKARDRLGEGALVATLADVLLGYDVFPGMFQLSLILNIPLYYYLVELLPDGYMEVSFIEPSPVEVPGQEVEHYRLELQRYVTDIVKRYGDKTVGETTTLNGKFYIPPYKVS